MNDAQEILDNINRIRLERMNEHDHDELAMVTGLAQLVCETLDKLFAMPPLDLCEKGVTENLDKFWSMHDKLLLRDWCAEYTSSEFITEWIDTNEIYSTLMVLPLLVDFRSRLSPSLTKYDPASSEVWNVATFQIKISMVNNIKSIPVGVLPGNNTPLIRSDIMYSRSRYESPILVAIVYYPLNEYNCHEGLSLKLYRAMTTYNITKMPLPAH